MAGRCCLHGLLAPASPGSSSTWLPHPHAKVWEKSGPSAGRLDRTVTFGSQDVACSSMGEPGRWEKMKLLWAGFRRGRRGFSHASCEMGVPALYLERTPSRDRGKAADSSVPNDTSRQHL